MKDRKKILDKVNIFKLDLYSTSYKSAALRITFSLLAMFLACLFRISITIENALLNFVLFAVILAIVIPAVLCFFVATAEFYPLTIKPAGLNMKILMLIYKSRLNILLVFTAAFTVCVKLKNAKRF